MAQQDLLHQLKLAAAREVVDGVTAARHVEDAVRRGQRDPAADQCSALFAEAAAAELQATQRRAERRRQRISTVRTALADAGIPHDTMQAIMHLVEEQAV